ncbi:hypothetical protein ACPJXG_02025 [Janthinobacterium sp. NFX145]|uniref:hypothetical protein n=1 Tax=Janthinobacterium sp. NFX145 TaxID=3415602 RepID=UPI003CC68C45
MKNLIYATGSRVLQIVCSALIIILSAIFLTKSHQGLLLTLNSIAAVQIFFELGFSSVILQYVGHERRYLAFDRVSGFTGPIEKLERLANIYRLASTWFNWGAIGCSIFLLIGGSLFFYDHSNSQDMPWMLPLIFLSICVPLSLYSQRFWVVYEGFGHINEVYKLRLCASVSSCVAIIIFFLYGYGLFAPIISPFFNFVFSQVLRIREYSFWGRISEIKFAVDAKKIIFKEILTLQSKISVSWLCGFFMIQSITPIVYKFSGPESAAVVGIGMSAVLITSGLLSVLLQVKIPELLELIKGGELLEYFSFGKKLAVQTFSASLVVSLIGGIFIALLNIFNINWLSSRLPDLHAYTFFMLAAIVNQIIATQATLTRLFKVEPYLYHSILVAVSTVLVITFAAKNSSTAGIAICYFLITLLVSLPSSTYIYLSEKKKRIPSAHNLHSNL